MIAAQDFVDLTIVYIASILHEHHIAAVDMQKKQRNTSY